MNYVSPTTSYKYNEIAHFKELVVGAGTKVFKANGSGVFAGSASYGSAPFKLSYAGALTATGANITGTINASAGVISGDLSITGTITGGITGESRIKIDGSDGSQKFYWGTTLAGTIQGLNGSPGGGEVEWLKISVNSGRDLSFQSSKIVCDGDFDVTGSYKVDNASGQTDSLQFITAIQKDGSDYQKKAITLDWAGGILTVIGSESGWETIS
jgi:hypothetical protein